MSGDRIMASTERLYWATLLLYLGTKHPEWGPWAALAFLFVGIVWGVLGLYRWAERREQRRGSA